MFPETFLFVFGLVRDVKLDLFVPALELKVQDRVLDLGQVILHLIVPDFLLKTGMVNAWELHSRSSPILTFYTDQP